MENKREINVQMQDLIDKTSKIKEDAQAVRSDAALLRQLLEEMGGCWQGKASESFEQSFSEDIIFLNKVILNLNNVCIDFSTACNTYEKSEERAAEIVKSIGS